MQFRDYHIINILNLYSDSKRPIDSHLRYYFKEHRALGSKDRRHICDLIYRLIRHQALLDYRLTAPITWEKRLNALKNPLPFPTDAPPHIQVSFPKSLFTRLTADYGLEKALELAKTSNEPAPTMIRANRQKITRDELFNRLADHHPIQKDPNSENALIFDKRLNFFALEEFKMGYFEVQDSGSQKLASLVNAKPKEHILDFCSGSGGKSLAFAPDMEGLGQIYLSDIRPFILDEAKKRFKRAGIQNVQFLTKEKLNNAALKHKMDAILLDVPCSGSGTLRRNPDLKWRYCEETLNRLIEEQRRIVKEALPFLKEDGRIIYGTCSLFQAENQEQIRFFETHYNLTLAEAPFVSHPKSGGGDGFFGAVLKRIK
ncbi:MAG: RsmB/NOP family class I SAM-dependent RNA methyltransferase [Simkaniaceae bacterium]